MISVKIAAAAFVAAMAVGLAATDGAHAQSIMRQCGDEWKAAKANNATNGQTWQEFLKDCRARHAAAAPAPAATPAAAAPKPMAA